MKIALYARVSTEKQEREETIQSQLSALRSFAAKEKHEIVGEYLDQGFSGELLARPELDRLRDDAKKKLFDAVLVHSPDRLCRKYIYLGIVKEELEKSGIAVLFLNRPNVKDTPEEKLLEHVQGAIAEYEKAKILERTRRGKVHKASSGILVTSIAPYGYKYVRNDKIRHVLGHYQVCPAEAKVVKLIFELFTEKRMSIRKIAKELTRLNIKPRRGTAWRTSSLHRIIRNETYTGTTHYNKHRSVETDNRRNTAIYRRSKNTSMRLRPKLEWIAIKLPDSLKIIDERTFASAQAMLRRNAELSPRNVKYQYLLRGLVKCGKCGAPFCGTPCHGKLYYRCGNRGRTFPHPKTCHVSIIRSRRLESLVWSKFCQVIQNPKLISQQVSRLREANAKKRKAAFRDVIVIDQEIMALGIEENRVLDAFREEIINADQLRSQMVKIQDKRKQLEDEKALTLAKQNGYQNRSQIKKSIRFFCKQVAKKLKAAEDNFEVKRFLLECSITSVVIDGKSVGITGVIPTYPIEDPSSCDIAFTSCS